MLADLTMADPHTGTTLLDEVMPAFDMRASYRTLVLASPQRVYACLWTADFDHWGVMRTLVALRALPTLFAAPRESWRRVRVKVARRRVRLEDVLAAGFTLLREEPGQELVLGTVGRFWLARGEHRGLSLESFREAGAPGTARAAWNFAVRPGTEGRTVLTTETRVLCADPATRRRFRNYWAVIAPFSGLIRREMLAAVREAAEAVPRPG